MQRKRFTAILIIAMIFSSAFALADTVDQTAMIEKVLSLTKFKDGLIYLQKTMPKAQFYEQTVAALNKNFDKGKLQKVIEWEQSPLGQKYSSLKITTYLKIKPLDAAAFALISEKRLSLLKQIREIEENLSLASMNIIFKQSLETTANGLLPEGHPIDAKQEKTIESSMKKLLESKKTLQLDFLASFYGSFSDDELAQFIEFQKSEPFQWFTDCLLKGYLKAMAMAIEKMAPHNDLETEAAIGLKDEFVLPDSQLWYMKHYCHFKETIWIIPMLKEALADQKLLSDTLRRSQFVHFIAAVLQTEDQLKQQIEKLKNSYSGDQQELISAIIKESDGFTPANPDSMQGVNRVWAEYYATGDEDILKRLFSLIIEPRNGSNQEFLHNAEVSIIKGAMIDYNVDTALTDFFANTDKNTDRKEIDKVSFAIKSLWDTAGTYDTKGYNYLYGGSDKREEAKPEFIRALTYAPGYQVPLTSLGVVYLEEKNDAKALACLQASLLLDYHYAATRHALGDYYLDQHSYDKAIENYQAALEIHANWATYIHDLALAYRAKGDKDNTVRYFKQYLDHAPYGEFADSVRAYLTSVGSPVHEIPGDTIAMLMDKRYDELDQFLNNLWKAHQNDAFGYSVLDKAYDRLANVPDVDSSKQKMHLLENWVKERPSSYFANFLLGRYCLDYAWQARGSGWGSTVTDEGEQLYKDRLQEARIYLEEAYELKPNDISVPLQLMTVVLGLGLDRSEMEKQFQRGVKIDPSNYSLYSEKLNYLKPRWYGTEKEMFNFARESANNALPHSFIPQILIDAHWDTYWYSKDLDYFKKPDVWKEVKSTYERLIKDFPDNKKVRNDYAYTAYLSGDHATAKAQFAIIKDNWSKDTWGNWDLFQKIKNEVLGE